MTREEALKRISELSCAYENIRMTECPHCRAEVESMVKMLMQKNEEKSLKNRGISDHRPDKASSSDRLSFREPS